MTGFKSKKTAALDEDGMYLVHHTKGRVFDKLGNKVNDDDTQVYGDAVDNNPVHEAMLSYWGERCTGYHEECVCCQAWEQYDGKTSAQPAQEPQRPWVDLTDNQIEQIYYDLVKIHRGAPMPWGQINFGKVLQAAIREANK